MGTRNRIRDLRQNKEDHPHAYGDKFLILKLAVTKYRIIPTRMGTRVADYAAETAVQDHPHAYGDKR